MAITLQFIFKTAVLLFINICGLSAQRLSARACTANSTIQALRAASASNASAAAACSLYCASSGQSGTGLFTSFCTAPARATCGLTSYFYNAPLVTGQTVVPTITNVGSQIVQVPCSYSGTVINGAQLAFSIPGTATANIPFYVNKQVVASTPTDTRTDYVTVSSTGVITFGPSVPPVDTTQTIAFTLSQRGTGVYSNTVNITFVFQSCVLNIQCPASPVQYCATSSSGSFPQLTCTVKNAPAGVQLVFDKPVDQGGLGTDTITLGQQQPLSQDQNAPFILDDQTSYANGRNGGQNEFIINLNAQQNPYPNNFGIYGPNPDNMNVADGCQILRFSVSPRDDTTTPYSTGSTAVQVCPNGPC